MPPVDLVGGEHIVADLGVPDVRKWECVTNVPTQGGAMLYER